MIQRRGSARLAFEAAQLCVVRRQPFRKKLERNFAPQSLVSCQVHLAHSTDTKERFDLIVTDRFTHYRACAMSSVRSSGTTSKAGDSMKFSARS